jgi:hypothetical protein
MYERCTPEEKRRPIEEAIDELLFFQPPEAEPIVEVRPEWATSGGDKRPKSLMRKGL